MPSAIIMCPFPFPDVEAVTKIQIYQEEDTEDQGPVEVLIYDGNAVYDRTSKNTFDKDSKMISLSGKLIIKGEVQVLGKEKSFTGFVKIGAETRRVHKISFPTLMGMVYSTEVDLL